MHQRYQALKINGLTSNSLYMKILIFGGGAIGLHLAYCLRNNKNKIAIIARGKHYSLIKKKGFKLTILQNKVFKKKVYFQEDNLLKFYNNFSKIKDKKFDYIFITVKLKDINHAVMYRIKKFTNNKTAIIPPCTSLPSWWFVKMFPNKKNLLKKLDNKDKILLDYKNNFIGMTLWLSSVIKKPGHVVIKHVQRGYPLKEINKKMKIKAQYLRDVLGKKCKSPKPKNIFSEIYTKAINSFVFNLVALKTEKNNSQILKDKNSIALIHAIMKEFDDIILELNLPIPQSINERIRQTLSSNRHTLSMLTDYKDGKKVELKYSWNTFNRLLNITNKRAPLTNKIYKLVKNKIRSQL